MIGCLEGKVIESNENRIIILTKSGVGYEVYYSGSIDLSNNEDVETIIFATNIVKETSNELYGFSSIDEKKIFELLISVKGVGPKSAFSMVTSIGPKDIVQAILMDNKKCLSSAPGIGKKAASQIVLDLSDKISKFSQLMNSKNVLAIKPGDQQEVFSGVVESHSEKYLNEAVMACKELGFKESEISTLAMTILQKMEISSSEQLIHQVLKEL